MLCRTDVVVELVPFRVICGEDTRMSGGAISLLTVLFTSQLRSTFLSLSILWVDRRWLVRKEQMSGLWKKSSCNVETLTMERLDVYGWSAWVCLRYRSSSSHQQNSVERQAGGSFSFPVVWHCFCWWGKEAGQAHNKRYPVIDDPIFLLLYRWLVISQHVLVRLLFIWRWEVSFYAGPVNKTNVLFIGPPIDYQSFF